MLLKHYIEHIGDAGSGALFGVKERTAASWRLGDRTPRHGKALDIVRLTKGRVSYSECYGVKPDVRT